MKDCWKILGIPKTRDLLVIRKAYRDRIKRWHPDTVGTPELVRHYTIKCAEVNEAYRRARDYCSAEIETLPPLGEWFERKAATPSTAAPRPQQTHSATTNERSIWATIRHVASVAVTFAFVLGIIIAVSNASPIVSWALSLPFPDYMRMIMFGVVAITSAIIFGWIVFAFEMLFVLFYITVPLADTKFSKYSLKAGWLVATFGNYFLYFGRSGWPFAHTGTGYFEVTYDLCKMLAWAIGPIVTAGFWLKEYLNYAKAKAVVDSSLASMSEEI